jgi:hypothetical protein
MEGMEKFFMCYMLFIVSFWKAEIFGRKKARSGKRESGKAETGRGFPRIARIIAN